MDPMKTTIRYLEKRATGWVWNCRRAKKYGMQPFEVLGTDDAAAFARAAMLNNMLDELRKGETGAPQPGTVHWMIIQIEQDQTHKDRPEKTRKEVEAAFKVIQHSPMGKRMMRDVTGKQIRAFYDKLAEAKTVDAAHRTCKWLRYLFSQALEAKHITMHPMDKMKLRRPAPRQVYWLEDEVAAAIAKAHETKRPSLALAIRLAFDLGQRAVDIRRMQCEQWDDTGMVISTGSIDGASEVVITQSKTGATVRIPALPELQDEITKAKADFARRGREWAGHMVRTEIDGVAYTEVYLSHEATEVIRAAGLTGKQFKDLRRSSVVRLAQAGCTIPEIAAITGHSYQQCEKILQTYLPRTTPLARAAIQRVLAKRREA